MRPPLSLSLSFFVSVFSSAPLLEVLSLQIKTITMESRMNTPKQPTRRYASRRKTVLNVDLNAPFLETQTNIGTSSPVCSQASEGAYAPANSQGPQLPANDGSHSCPIDVEAIDDDILIISSSSWFHKTGQSRRSHSVTEVLEDHSAQTGVGTEDSVTALYRNSHNKHAMVSPNTVINSCCACSAAGVNPKRKRVVVSPVEPPEKVVPEEVNFTCPICLDTLTEPCSTICGHIFCQSCIKTAIRAQKKCPTCRRKLAINRFHRVFLPATK